MIRLLVAAEDGLGCRLAKHIADDCCHAVEWVGESLDAFRTWCEFEGGNWLPLARVSQIAKQRKIRAWGRFDGAPGAEDAVLVRKLIRVLHDLDMPIDVLIVARDVDHTERRTGFEQARMESRIPIQVVGALAQPEFEAWLVAAWTPKSEAELSRHEVVTRELGLDPVQCSHELTSTARSNRDCKTVLESLIGSTEDAEAHFRQQSCDLLVARGAHNGLADYVREICPLLHRLLGAPRRSS